LDCGGHHLRGNGEWQQVDALALGDRALGGDVQRLFAELGHAEVAQGDRQPELDGQVDVLVQLGIRPALEHEHRQHAEVDLLAVECAVGLGDRG
jgi:hypothetical protein